MDKIKEGLKQKFEEIKKKKEEEEKKKKEKEEQIQKWKDEGKGKTEERKKKNTEKNNEPVDLSDFFYQEEQPVEEEAEKKKEEEKADEFKVIKKKKPSKKTFTLDNENITEQPVEEEKVEEQPAEEEEKKEEQPVEEEKVEEQPAEEEKVEEQPAEEEEKKEEQPVEEEKVEEQPAEEETKDNKPINPPQVTNEASPTSSSSQKVPKSAYAEQRANVAMYKGTKQLENTTDNNSKGLGFKIREPKREDSEQQRYENKTIKKNKQLPDFKGERTFFQKAIGFLGTITLIPAVLVYLTTKKSIGGIFTEKNQNEEIKNWVEEQGNEKLMKTFQEWANENSDIKNAYKEWFENDKKEIQDNYYQEEKIIVPVRDKTNDKSQQIQQQNKNTMPVDNNIPTKSKETINNIQKQNIRQ